MAARSVVVRLTVPQAHALVRLAECAANTWDDAMSVLVDAPRVEAGFRAIQAVNAALYGTPAEVAP